MIEGHLRYLLKRGKGGKPREKVLQQYINGRWIEVPMVYEQGLGDECPLGGNIADDCKDCVYSGEYHYDEIVGDCVMR